jgi:hypothetical protein
MRIKTQSRFLLALAALASSLAVLAPAASADFAFESPPPLVRAHPPQHFPDPGGWIGYQGFMFEEEWDAWQQQVDDLPELTQAGGHPDLTTRFSFAQSPEDPTGSMGDGHPRTIVVDTPAGMVGNPRAVPRCPAADFHATLFGACASETQLGETLSDAGFRFLSPVYSLIPYPGVPALIGFKAYVITVGLVPEVRSDGDYGLRVTADEVPLPVDYVGTTLTLWGVPHDPVHDPHRIDSVGELGGHIDGVPKPFLSAPTNCQSGPLSDTVKVRTWEHPDTWIESTNPAAEPTGCDQLSFEPTLSAKPSTTVADSPSGLEVDLQVPQHEGCEVTPGLEGKFEELQEVLGVIQEKRQEAEAMREKMEALLVENKIEEWEKVAKERQEVVEELQEAQEELNGLATEPFYDCGLATSHLRDARVTLPAGLAVNPASANGLDGCSPSEAGLTTPLGQIPVHFNGKPANCPDASRIGDVEVDTPLIDDPLVGSVFLADPYDNPFKSFLSLYIAVNDPKTGIVATLAGEVKADPVTGQLTARFPENPQLPFEHFFLHFKQGPHAPLRTPAVCGTYETEAELVPYSDPDSSVINKDTWQITQAPSGSCASDQASLPNSPSLDAGTVSPSAGSFSPFVMHLRRDDGSQNFKAVNVSPPPGLVAKLAGVGRCSEADLAAAASKSGKEEQASPSCPASSRLGEVIAGAGAGPSPYYAKGVAYLTGPYKGAPLGLAIITPATAGPFDLGTIVVRTALKVDPVTARITAISDDIPQILNGIPLDVRTVDIAIDRDRFTQTGTSCDPSSVDGQLTSTLGSVASIQSRFQLAECSSLGFKPKLRLNLKGGTTRGKHPALTAILTPRAGDANIAAVSVALPRSEFLDQGHIGTVCTRVQFAADQCPAASIYGKATVTTPLFDFPLTGNVYLRSSNNELPDLVPDLRGPASMPVKVEAAGRTDSIRGGIRNTFDYVPDAPFTKLVMELRGGKKGLLQNSRNICSDDFRATVQYTAHSGKAREGHPELVNSKCAKAKKRGGKGAKAHKRALAMRSALR